MGEQFFQRSEPQLVTPEGAASAKPIEFSPETIDASASIAESVVDQKPFPQTETDALLCSITADLERSGIILNPEEKRNWNGRIKRVFETDQTVEVTNGEFDKIDLRDYADVLKGIHTTYNLRDVHAKLLTATGIMAGTRVFEGLRVASFFQLFSIEGLGKIVGKWGDFDKAYTPESGSRDMRSVVGKGIKLAGPALFAILGSLPLSIADEMAKKWFIQELTPMREAINKRIAQSIFMRDFEFVQDKSAAEIMNIVEKGKEATLDLISDTYKEIMPRLASIGGSLIPQLASNRAGVLLGLIKIPVLYGATTTMTKSILRQRHEDLVRKDQIDTRIATTLGSLETVKTSDSIDRAMEELQAGIRMRDTIRTESEKRRIATSKRGEQLMNLVDIGTLASVFGWEYIKQRQQPTQTGTPMMGDLTDIFSPQGIQTAMEMVYGRGLAQAYMAFMKTGQILGAQAETNTKAQELAYIYAQRIQPSLQDIKRMEELLGPYHQVDTPDGPREKARMAVEGLNNFDISVKNLSFKDILHDVSLDVPQGSFVTIKGPSGIGKTTFFRHLMGLYGAREGTVQYGGVDLQNIKKFGEQSVYSKIAYANQNPQFFENMTLRENLLLWTKKPTTDIEIRQTLHDLRLDGLIDRLDSKVKHYSGGELRRIGIARALLKDPRVLFLDEPTANLDEESAKQVLEIIKGLRVKRPEMTVVAVTHDPSFEAIAEKIVHFKEINRKPVEQVLVGSADATKNSITN